MIRFGVFEVNAGSGELRKQGVRVKLQEQPFQLLLALLEHPSEVVSREELQKRLWPGGTFVDFDAGLNKAVKKVRDAIGDDADNPRFIETLPQRGYRFIAPLERIAPEPVSTPPVVPYPRHKRRIWTIAALLLLSLVLSIGVIRAVTGQRIESIAVLPLENLSGNPDREYFSDGMTEALINELASITSLRVISRTSVMPYKKGRKSLPDIARELNVDAIVEGSVVESGGRVRITAQLIRAKDDRHIWASKYDRDLTDILALQEEVATDIARGVRTRLVLREEPRPNRKVNAEAHHAMLTGNFLLYQGMRGVEKSIESFTRAIAIDPSYAEAHAGLAQALVMAGIYGLRPSAETHPEARRAASKALEFDNTDAGAHNALADVWKGYDWDLKAAEAEHRRAVALNPSHLLTRLWYAETLTRMGRFDEALKQSDVALALDPVSPISYNNRAMLLWRMRRYDEAIAMSRHSLVLDPGFVNALWWQGLAYSGKGDHRQAIASLEKAVQFSGNPLLRAALGYVYGVAGEQEKALSMLRDLQEIAGRRHVSPVDFAIIYGGLQDREAAFEWMEKAYQQRETRVHELPQPYFDSLRKDKRYADLMRRVGLTFSPAPH